MSSSPFLVLATWPDGCRLVRFLSMDARDELPVAPPRSSRDVGEIVLLDREGRGLVYLISNTAFRGQGQWFYPRDVGGRKVEIDEEIFGKLLWILASWAGLSHEDVGGRDRLSIPIPVPIPLPLPSPLPIPKRVGEADDSNAEGSRLKAEGWAGGLGIGSPLHDWFRDRITPCGSIEQHEHHGSDRATFRVRIGTCTLSMAFCVDGLGNSAWAIRSPHFHDDLVRTLDPALALVKSGWVVPEEEWDTWFAAHVREPEDFVEIAAEICWLVEEVPWALAGEDVFRASLKGSAS